MGDGLRHSALSTGDRLKPVPLGSAFRLTPVFRPSSEERLVRREHPTAFTGDRLKPVPLGSAFRLTPVLRPSSQERLVGRERPTALTGDRLKRAHTFRPARSTT